MTREDIIRMAREAGFPVSKWDDGVDEVMDGDNYHIQTDLIECFANLVAAAERNSAAEIAGDFARKWWSLHCATNKHMETTLMAHNDFCALQSAIRARGEK